MIAYSLTKKTKETQKIQWFIHQWFLGYVESFVSPVISGLLDLFRSVELLGGRT